jgi:hypothetical protein
MMRFAQLAIVVLVLVYHMCDAYKAGTVDGINKLQTTMLVDNNEVVTQAAKSPDGKTYIFLVTPKDNWKKQLIITATGMFGYTMSCGDHDGNLMKGVNSNNKYAKVQLPDGTSPISIQFLKAKTFGVMTNYGTMNLPGTIRGHHIVFFWPKDAPGDGWNNFMNILKQGQKMTSEVAGIADNVVKVGQDGASLIAMFK